MPNGLVINTEIKNITRDPRRRLDLIIGVGYNSDIEKAKEILMQVATKCPYTLNEPKPIIGVSNFNASSIDITYNVYVLSPNYVNAKFYLLENIKKEFDNNNIEIPYPQVDVHVKGDVHAN